MPHAEHTSAFSLLSPGSYSFDGSGVGGGIFGDVHGQQRFLSPGLSWPHSTALSPGASSFSLFDLGLAGVEAGAPAGIGALGSGLFVAGASGVSAGVGGVGMELVNRGFHALPPTAGNNAAQVYIGAFLGSTHGAAGGFMAGGPLGAVLGAAAGATAGTVMAVRDVYSRLN